MEQHVSKYYLVSDPYPVEQLTVEPEKLVTGTVTLTWDPPSNSEVDEYIIKHHGTADTAELADRTITAVTLRLEGLLAGDNYTYSVISVSNGKRGNTMMVSAVQCE